MNNKALNARIIKVGGLDPFSAATHFCAQTARTTTFLAAHEGKNPRKLVLQACPSGDPGAFHEMAVSIHKPNGECIADILIGIDDKGEARILVTTDADGDGDKKLAIYPERALPSAVDMEWV